ncbi:MAG: hypothetical protein ACI4SE_07610 [Lachnospiraceae bacterium]
MKKVFAEQGGIAMKWRSIKAGAAILSFLLLAACATENNGSQEMGNAADESSVSGKTDEDHQEEEIVLHSDFLTQSGVVEQTWQPDYDASEWEESPIIYVYVAVMESSEDSEIPEIEDACNHYLHEKGYDFQVHFLLQSAEDFFNGVSADQGVAQKQEEGTVIDLYMTLDYKSAMEEGRILDLTEYLTGSEGEPVYKHFDEMIWNQLRNDDGLIYGIPVDPVVADKRVYCYNPQLAELLGVDMQEFDSKIQNLEEYFSKISEYHITPVCLGNVSGDKLLLSEIGLETYGDIIAVRHEGDSWEAVDLWEEEELMAYYEYLGYLKEKGYLTYSEPLIAAMNWIDTPIEDEMSSGNYKYCFLSIDYIHYISWAKDINMAEDGYVETDYYIPDEQGYIYENRNNHILVINSQTQYPEASIQFAKLLVTDDELKSLLYNGIENYHYMWQDGTLIYDSSVTTFPVGLGFEYDRSFMSEECEEKYGAEISELNANVMYAASMEVPCDFSEMDQIYEACKAIFEENWIVFWGYYGDETSQKLEELHETLVAAGYLQLIEYVNASR